MSETTLRQQATDDASAINALRETIERLTKERDLIAIRLFATDDDSIVASCNCLTKTPEAHHHKKGCKYRLICERDEARVNAGNWERQWDRIVTESADYNEKWNAATARAERLETELRRVEWSTSRDACCPACHQTKTRGHASACSLATALKGEPK